MNFCVSTDIVVSLRVCLYINANGLKSLRYYLDTTK